MKFETGSEKQNRERRKAEGVKLGPLEEYKDFNSEFVDEILEKRKKEREDLIQRQNEKIKKLEEAEKNGKLFIR